MKVKLYVRIVQGHEHDIMNVANWNVIIAPT